MDIKDLIIPGDASLPTAQDALSSSTAAPGLPAIHADASTYAKTGASAVLGLAGTFYLIWGKRSNDVQKMVIGAALTIASFLLF